jgi:hypothetical protein
MKRQPQPALRQSPPIHGYNISSDFGSIRSGFNTAPFSIDRLRKDQLTASTFLKTFNTVRLSLKLPLPLRGEMHFSLSNQEVVVTCRHDPTKSQKNS